MRTLLFGLTILSLTPSAMAFESGCVINGEPCIAGAPTARARWGGGPAGRAHAAEHAQLFDAILAASGVPADAAAPMRWTQYDDGSTANLTSSTTCKLPENEQSLADFLRGVGRAGLDAIFDPVGAFRDAVDDVERVFLGLVQSQGALEFCNQGTCTPSAAHGQGIGVCVWEGATLRPTRFDQVAHVSRRTRTPAELTQLPDYGWSMHDLLTGFETCPVDIADVGDCHTFSRHMGAYNSSHFPPQSQDFFAHYHQLALDRAAACAADLADVPADPRFDRFKAACLGEAMAYEAVAQHYLHDTWSMGHTWQRWGAPEPSRSVPYAEAHLVALTAGIIHGTKSVICVGDYCPDDAMNAPAAGVHMTSEEGTHAAVGDLFLDTLLNDPDYATQKAQLFACASTALRDVYRAAGEPVGALAAATTAGADMVDPASAQCFGQRATNRALWVGAGVNGRVGGVDVNLRLADVVVHELVVNASVAKRGAAGLSAAEQLRLSGRYHVDMALLAVKMAAETALNGDATTLADGGLPAVLGATPNGLNRVEGPPASFVDTFADADPRNANTPDGDRKHALHASYAAQWCQAFDGSDPAYDLETLRARVEATREARDFADDASVARSAAACSVCLDFAERHTRVGAGPDAYDADREPLCHYLAPDAAQFVYVPEEACGIDLPPELARTPAERYCGCADSSRLFGPNVSAVGRSTGDPHLTTLDGLAFDFQAAGEFVFVSDGAGVQVQVRQEPVDDSVCQAVSVNTAVSARIGGIRVSAFADDPQVWFDGERRLLEGLSVLDDCSRVFPTADGFGMIWATGEILMVSRQGGYLDLAFVPADDRAGAYEGLLGDFDGDPLNDLRDANGGIIGVDPLAAADLYTGLRTAWLAVDHGRLFEDRPDEGPGAFDRDDFPVLAEGVDGFTPEAQAAAQAVCLDAGVGDGHRLRECALDVFCMGPDAAAAFVGQREPVAVAEVDFDGEVGEIDDPNCNVRADQIISADGVRRARVECVAGCEDSGSVWGTDIYTDDSRVCRAAIHAGRLEIGVAGPVFIEHRPGQDAYVGSLRNGVQTSDWGTWAASFVFIDAP